MYKFGDLVYFDELYFSKNTKDEKDKRPCVVLCNHKDKDGNDMLYICEVTSRVNKVNKYPNSYTLISKNIKYYGVLSFIKHSYPFLVKNEGVHPMNISLDDVDKERILDKFTKLSEVSKNSNKFKYILEKIYIERNNNEKPYSYIKIKND